MSRGPAFWMAVAAPLVVLWGSVSFLLMLFYGTLFVPHCREYRVTSPLAPCRYGAYAAYSFFAALSVLAVLLVVVLWRQWLARRRA